MLAAIAFRNLWRNRRRTLLTLSAMVVSSSLLILALGVFSGMLQDMLASATEQYHGHIVISKQGYQDERDLYATFKPGEITARAAQEEGILAVSRRLRGFGLLSSPEVSRPVELLGIDPLQERNVTTLTRQLVAGTDLSTSTGNQVLLGTGLAERLGVSPGEALVFFTQAADGSIGNDLLQVAGIFATGDPRHDNNLALVGLNWLQNLLVLPGQIHEIAVRIVDPRQASELADRLAANLPSGLEVLDWGDLLPEMREAVASFDVSRMIIVLILYAATGLGILNTFFMSVMERTREFGILMALGMRPWRVRSMVLLETLQLGLFAMTIGVVAGVLMTWYMQQIGIDLSGQITPVTYAGGTILPRLHATFEAANIWIPSALLLLVCLIAGFLPANRAAKLKPVEALREE
jgi:ABC-type lipoprotein release transport system permease subunit